MRFNIRINAIVALIGLLPGCTDTRISQRWGRDPQILGDQDEWRAARDAVAQLMDRYHAVDARRRFAG